VLSHARSAPIRRKLKRSVPWPPIYDFQLEVLSKVLRAAPLKSQPKTTMTTPRTKRAILKGEFSALDNPLAYGYYTARIWQTAIPGGILMPTKVTVNLPDETVNAMKRIASAKGTTVTEALRQLIETQSFLLDELQKGNNLLIQNPTDKSVRQIIFNVPLSNTNK
jgi:hypothetical protein